MHYISTFIIHKSIEIINTILYNYKGDYMKYFYSWGLLFVLPFTIYAYIKADKNVRLKMMIFGSIFGLMAVIFDYMYLNYWNPVYLFDNFHFEDFMYGFLFAGILPGINNIFGRYKMKGKLKANYILGFIYIFLIVAIFYLITVILKCNYIYALSLAPLIIGIISYIKVKGKITDILVTIIASLTITILVYNIILIIYPRAINNHFFIQNISGIIILNIPIEEILFAICLAVGCTYTYEAVFNQEIIRKKQS